MKVYYWMVLFLLLIGFIPAERSHAADFTVSTAAELITAINTANSNEEVDTITLTGHIVLNAVDNSTEGRNGLPSILADRGNSLTIDGAGFSIRRDVNGTQFRVFHVGAAANLVLRDVTISGGTTEYATDGPNAATSVGGGIFNRGTLTLDNAQVTQNVSIARGGGIYTQGNLNIINGSIIGGVFGVDGNRTLNGGGAGIMASSVDFNGQPLLLRTRVLMQESTVAGNEAIGGRGAGIYGNGVDFEIFDSVIGGSAELGNQADTAGGGINADNGSTLMIADSLLSHNSTSSSLGGGGIYLGVGSTAAIHRTQISENTATNRGGGILGYGSVALELYDSIVIANAANVGDSIAYRLTSVREDSTYMIHIERTTLDASGSAALVIQNQVSPATVNPVSYTIDLTVQDSALIGGMAGNGTDAIDVFSNVFPSMDAINGTVNLTLSNVTVDGFIRAVNVVANSTSSTDSLVNLFHNLRLRNVSLHTSGAGFNVQTTTQGQAGAENEIIFDITNSYLAGPGGTNDCNAVANNGLGTITFSGNDNLSTGTACPAIETAGFSTTTLEALNLIPLADNGGQTPTIALNAGSVALDAAGALATITDQRGAGLFNTRDIGAYEAGGVIPSVSYTLETDAIKESETAIISITLNDYAGVPVMVQIAASGVADESDYAFLGPTEITFTESGTQTLSLQALVDDVLEENETLTITAEVSGNVMLISEPQTLMISEVGGFPPRTYPFNTQTVTSENFNGPHFTFLETDGVEWYRVWVGAADYSFTVLDEWYPVTDASTGAEPESAICVDGLCTVPEPIWLSNGNYVWWITYWMPGDGLDEINLAWNDTTFSVMVDPPADTLSYSSPADAAELTAPPTTLTFERDPNTLWYQIWVGPDDYSAEVYFDWVAADSICVGTVCKLPLDDALFVDGSYEIWTEAWGPGGYVTWTDMNMGTPSTFTLNTQGIVPRPLR